MTSEKVSKLRKRILKILGVSLVVFLFAIIGVEMAYKFANKTFYFYNHRYDVVLTDSMSAKNEKYQDFLKDTEQIHAFDFVISEKIDDSTKLDVFDVVLFDNPDIGMDMHRIVEIERVGDIFELNNLDVQTINGKETFKYVSPSSSIVLQKTFIYTDLEVVTYTEQEFNKDEYYFNIAGKSVDPTIASIKDGEYYRNTITYHRDSSAPAAFSITKKNYDYASYFESIKLSGGNSDVVINSSIVQQAEENKYIFNVNERYLIRGDKANTDDGWYEREQLESKVINVIPKFGYVARFLSTPYGTIMLVGLMFIPITYWIFFSKKKENKKGDKNEKQS